MPSSKNPKDLVVLRFKTVTANIWNQKAFLYILLLLILVLFNFFFPVLEMMLISAVALFPAREKMVDYAKKEVDAIVLEIKLMRFIRLNGFYDVTEKTTYTLKISYLIVLDKTYLRVVLDGFSDTSVILNEKIDERVQAIMRKRIEERRVADDFSFVEFEFYNQPDERITISKKREQNKDEPIQITKRRAWNYRSNPHAILTGSTGSGKTYFIFYLIKELLNRGEIVSVIDPKNSDLRALSKYLVTDVKVEKEAIMDEILGSVKEMKDRYAQMNNDEAFSIGLNYYHYNMPAKFLIIDEFSAFVAMLDSKEKKEVDKALLQLLQMGRSCGFFVLFSMQRADAEFLKPAVRDQLSFRIALSRTSDDGLRMVFGSDSANLNVITENQKGYMKTNEMTKPILFEPPFFDVDINDYFEN